MGTVTLTAVFCSLSVFFHLTAILPLQKSAFIVSSVLGAHVVVDEDVEGGVDIGVDLQHSERHEVSVLVATPRVHLRDEEQHESAYKNRGFNCVDLLLSSPNPNQSLPPLSLRSIF